jgi:H+/Cl- antiporter ClcA
VYAQYVYAYFVCVCVCEGTLLSHYPEFAPAVSPREFALIGAAAFSTGVTRAVSTTVIVYELSGHKHIHLPLSGATSIISLSLCNV